MVHADTRIQGTIMSVGSQLLTSCEAHGVQSKHMGKAAVCVRLVSMMEAVAGKHERVEHPHQMRHHEVTVVAENVLLVHCKGTSILPINLLTNRAWTSQGHARSSNNARRSSRGSEPRCCRVGGQRTMMARDAPMTEMDTNNRARRRNDREPIIFWVRGEET